MPAPALQMASILDPQNKAQAAEDNKMETETFATWILPPLCTSTAFFTYQNLRQVFHTCIDVASGNTWAVADGGKFMAEMVRSNIYMLSCYSMFVFVWCIYSFEN